MLKRTIVSVCLLLRLCILFEGVLRGGVGLL